MGKDIKEISACILLTLACISIYVSCKKENSCTACLEINKPPIANAGLDLLTTLPTDSVALDGTASSDPDGKISSYLWTKIAGPASFSILKPTDSISKLKSLIASTYQF